jgi:hypothetical protein
MIPPCTGDGLIGGWGVIPMSLKIDVKLPSDALEDAGEAGAGVVVRPNSAVNSPTFFFGGSIGWEEKDGISAGLSP